METLLPWLTLKSVRGVGNLLIRRLIRHFQTPERVLNASRDELLAVDGINSRSAAALMNHQTPDWVKRELDRLDKSPVRIVTMTDPEYPPLLLEISDPPPYLYVYGSLEQSDRSVAVVGSRNATDYGISATRSLCRDLAAYKLTVVSGLARGVDTAAHKGAIEGKGRTIAVMGSGFNNIYPPENRRLAKRIAEHGAVISEFCLSAGPEAHHFPIRNRIISGISLGTLVVEATRKSGSLITARLAAEQNREVFAVPGSVHSFKSTGTHTLIKQGAKLVEHAKDVIDEFGPFNLHVRTGGLSSENSDRRIPTLSDDEATVFKALSVYPVHIDELARKLSIPSGMLSSALLQLELKGLVRQAPGNLFSIEPESTA